VEEAVCKTQPSIDFRKSGEYFESVKKVSAVQQGLCILALV